MSQVKRGMANFPARIRACLWARGTPARNVSCLPGARNNRRSDCWGCLSRQLTSCDDFWESGLPSDREVPVGVPGQHRRF
jgi:hypothetical protein